MEDMNLEDKPEPEVPLSKKEEQEIDELVAKMDKVVIDKD